MQSLPAESLRMIDDWYAREYEPVEDLKLLWKNYLKLGGDFINNLLILHDLSCSRQSIGDPISFI